MRLLTTLLWEILSTFLLWLSPLWALFRFLVLFVTYVLWHLKSKYKEFVADCF